LLKESEERFRNLAQSATEAIIILDAKGSIIFWNESAERMYGYSEKEVLRKNNSMLVPNRLLSQSERYFDKLRRDRTITAPDHLYESFARKKDGSEFPVEVALSIWDTDDTPFYCVMLRDITERKRVEKIIKESEDKFRTMAENITAAIFIYQHTHLIYANTAATKLSGYLNEELIGMRFWNIIHPDFKEQATEWDRMQQAGEKLPSRFELKIKTKNGEERWVDYTAAIIEYNGAEAVLGTAVDITERKQAEELINKVNKTLLSLGPDSDQNIQTIVEKAATILGGANASYHRKQGKALTIAAMWNLPQHYRTMNPAIADSFDRMISLYSGSPVIISDMDKISLSPRIKRLHKSAVKQFVAMPVSMGPDIIGSLNVGYNDRRKFSATELNIFSILAQAIGNEELRKKALVELEQHKIQLQNSEKNLKAFSGRILSIREEEKKNISSALHDELGSLVVSLSSGLMIAREEIIENNLEPALKCIERTEAALIQAVENLKNIIVDLRPPNLEIVGLSSALNELCTKTAQQTKIAIDCNLDVEDSTIDEDTAITLYRSAQEALNNALKHARAKNVTLRLCREKNNLKLTITDDGRGMNTTSLDSGLVSSGRIGLQGIRERVAALGGTFFLQSASQKGTAVHITIPAKKRRRP
jgi:PAS domain S-box-containing protein